MGAGRFRKLAGQVVSGQEVVECSRVGSGWVKRCFNAHGLGRVESGQEVITSRGIGPPCPDPIREKPGLTPFVPQNPSLFCLQVNLSPRKAFQL